jgi:hypothetical protein
MFYDDHRPPHFHAEYEVSTLAWENDADLAPEYLCEAMACYFA